MPEPAATTPLSSPDGTVPPMPSEVTPVPSRTKGHAAAGRWRAAMMPVRKMMHRTPRGAV